MKRGNFLKSLLTVIAAPSLISKLEIGKEAVVGNSITEYKHFENYGMLIPKGATSMLFQDLNELMPTYRAEIERKYGYVSYEWTLNKNNKL